MTDIVERLRAERPQFYESTMKEAADEIERLRVLLRIYREDKETAKVLDILERDF
jgi:hypothetical protein